MCGLLGGLLTRPADEEGLDRALASLHHRGPDQTSRWLSPDKRVFLGHTRLSIIGINNGEQPIADPLSGNQIVVNGEFYGYREIRRQLQAEGCRFATDSDSEIALHLYRRLGPGMFGQLNGEFAGLIANREDNSIFAFRDRFGIKPLFYAEHEGGIYFASEIKALLALGVPSRWDLTAMHEEAFLVRPHTKSVFAGIYSVPAGHFAIARNGKLSIHRYWDLEFPSTTEHASDKRREDEIIAGFRAVLEASVLDRMQADVEVGAYLSGGIDSCATLAIAQSLGDKPINAFTLSFDDSVYDETRLARAQAEYCGARHHSIPVKPVDIAMAYSDAIWHAEAPFFNGHGVAKYLLSKTVRKMGIKAVISGEGADEMLAGYAPFRQDILQTSKEEARPGARENMLASMRASNRAVPALARDDIRIPQNLQPARRVLGFVPNWMVVFCAYGDMSQSMYSQQMQEVAGRHDPFAACLAGLAATPGLHDIAPLNKSLYSWSKHQLVNYILNSVGDRMEMANSVEGRVPFLDTRVAEFCAGIPPDMKIRGQREKYVLREAVRDLVIDPVYTREKHPFATPPAKSGEADKLLEFYGDIFFSGLLDEQPIYSPTAVRRAFKLFKLLPAEKSIELDGFLNRAISAALMHQRFGMSA
jgi:asparagine synthase (glutamine-hydrolysing)